MDRNHESAGIFRISNFGSSVDRQVVSLFPIFFRAPCPGDSAIASLTRVDTSSKPSSSNSWSSQIAERYQCKVDPALAAWWDDGVWEMPGSGEFRTAVSPQSLLADHPECLWPGLMPCHQLPIIENGRGDCLAVRMSGNQLREIVYWYHGGGDWIPWGDDLSQTLIFNHFASRLPGFESRHSREAEPVAVVGDSNAWLDFATARLPKFIWDNEASPMRSAQSMVNAGIAKSAVLAGLIAEHFDHYSIDDWIKAAIEKNPNLAWGWEAAGRRAEAKGKTDLAIEMYQRGARCSVFTSQSVRMKTHLDEDEVCKFSLGKLKTLVPDAVAEDEYLQGMTLPTLAEQQRATSEYWLGLADQLEAGSPEQMFSLHMSAWDLGLPAMSDYAEIMKRLIACAEAGGLPGRSALTKVHLDTLVHRYLK
jgi:hypothetical protein